MRGRVALITGAGRGIGLGMAQALATEGCAVAIQDVDLEVAEEAATVIKKNGGKAIALGGDIQDLSLPDRLVRTTENELGGLHILINNAAVQQRGNWLDLVPEDMERIFSADIVSPLLLCQLASRIFCEQRWGRIINLGSIQGKGGNAEMLPYSMSKAALQNLTMALARDLGPSGVTVNMISPGYFNTWRNREEFKTPEDFARNGKHIPLRRVGQPEDCAGLALLLCSDAGAYITGQTIYVDGGMSAR